MNALFLQLIYPLSIPGSVEITKKDLYEIREQGMRHNLFQLMYSQLQKNQMRIFPQDLVDEFLKESKGLYLKGITVSAMQEAMEKEINTLLSKHGIPSVVVRGNAIARELYNDTNSRVSSDIDILVKISDVIRADSLFSKAGYARNDSLPLEFWFYRIHHAVYHHPKIKNIIEVHWNFGIPSFFKLSSEDIWDKITETDSGQLRLTPEMMIIMLLIHHHMHSFRELKILTDIVWSLDKYKNSIDWHMFALKIREIGLVKIVKITIRQIHTVWENAVDEISSVRELQNEMQKMRYREPKALTFFLKLDFDSPYSFQNYKDKLIAHFSLDDLSTILFSFIKILLPFPQAVKAFYAEKRNWTLPFHYVRFIRWRLKEWSKKGNVLR